jgi:hypothetical protein
MVNERRPLPGNPLGVADRGPDVQTAPNAPALLLGAERKRSQKQQGETRGHRTRPWPAHSGTSTEGAVTLKFSLLIFVMPGSVVNPVPLSTVPSGWVRVYGDSDTSRFAAAS